MIIAAAAAAESPPRPAGKTMALHKLCSVLEGRSRGRRGVLRGRSCPRPAGGETVVPPEASAPSAAPCGPPPPLLLRPPSYGLRKLWYEGHGGCAGGGCPAAAGAAPPGRLPRRTASLLGGRPVLGPAPLHTKASAAVPAVAGVGRAGAAGSRARRPGSPQPSRAAPGPAGRGRAAGAPRHPGLAARGKGSQPAETWLTVAATLL